jgi:maltose alpha-D-glucosyltransferase / alpha-amylase
LSAPDARISISMRSDFNNTTCAIGDKLFVKLFRRIEPGTNPELEVTRFLRNHRFNQVPSLAGALEFRRNGDAYQLGMVTEVIPEAVTGWKATVDALGRFFDRVRALPPEKALPQPSGTLLALSTADMPADVAMILGIHGEQARLLGQRTGEMHAALASDADNKDFAPEPFTPFYQRSLYQSMRNQAVEVLDVIKQNLAAFPDTTRPLALQVVALQTTILGRLRAVADTPMDAQRIRAHGDYHLTQVLYTGKDFVIIDFEGDWSRPMSERRIKRTPLRDAATMIRSFDYAAHLALAKEQERGHFTTEQLVGMDPWVRFWSRWTGAAFLRGYLAAVGPSGVLPKTASHLELLLDALLLNRTLAELGDEFTNRPGSVHIPLKGVLELMEPR